MVGGAVDGLCSVRDSSPAVPLAIRHADPAEFKAVADICVAAYAPFVDGQPAMRAAHRVYERVGLRPGPSRDWSRVPRVDLLAVALVLGGHAGGAGAAAG